jgi:drug/metabolite transporter (DMT)-like permease
MFTPTNPHLRAFGALALAGLIWGSSDVASKIALGAVPPITLALLRICLALLICWPLARRRPLSPLRSLRLPVLGLIGVAGALLLQNSGLERTAAANGSMLQGAAPILVILGAAVFLRESPGYARSAGVLTALAGVAAITLTGQHAFAIPGSGDLYVLGSAACFAAFVVLGRPVFVDFGTIPVLAATYAWAFVFLAPLATAEAATRGIGRLEPSTLGLLLFLGVGCSALAHTLWGYALRHLEASQAAVFDNLIPIVGIVAAALFLRERPTGWELAGGALVILGAWIASRPRHADPPLATGSA